MKMKTLKKNKGVIIILIIVFVLLLINLMPKETSQVILIQWDDFDIVGKESYLIEEQDFDFSEELQNVALEIKALSLTPEEAIQNTAKYVVNNVQYDGSVSIAYCYQETASKVLEKGLGDCVSMSRLFTSLARIQGIPTRTSGGCISFNERCDPIYAVYSTMAVQGPDVKEIDLLDNKKRGYLHEWVEAWNGEEWILVEATAGRIFSKECAAYTAYSYDSDQYNRCVINDYNFINQCRSK